MKPKKSLGQNFLKDKTVLDKIISTADLSVDDLVVEVGPGEGVLTEELVKRAGKVVAIEIDSNLADKLKEKYKNNQKVEIISDDILKINLPEMLGNISQLPSSGPSTDHLLPKGEGDKEEIIYKVIANIPYYITSPIIQLFLETIYPPKEMILMVQKEVAERICAEPGEMSILAVSVQYYAKTELLFNVDRKAFWPVPEVDSAVIKVSRITNHASKEEVKKIFRVVRAGFSARRKMLVNNLVNSFHIDKEEAEKIIKKIGLSPKVRAQELSIENWKLLSKHLGG